MKPSIFNFSSNSLKTPICIDNVFNQMSIFERVQFECPFEEGLTELHIKEMNINKEDLNEKENLLINMQLYDSAPASIVLE